MLHQSYPHLFGTDAEESEQEGDDDGGGAGDGGDVYAKKFSERWFWVDWSVAIREIYGCTLDKVFELGIVEYLNLMCYIKDRGELEKRQMKQKGYRI